MAFTRKLTETGDYAYDAGRALRVEDVDAIIQAVRVGLTTIRGENRFHPGIGLDLNGIGSGSVDAQKASIASACIRTGRITRVVSIERTSLPGKDRKRSYAVRAITQDGTTIDFGVNVDG